MGNGLSIKEFNQMSKSEQRAYIKKCKNVFAKVANEEIRKRAEMIKEGLNENSVEKLDEQMRNDYIDSLKYIESYANGKEYNLKYLFCCAKICQASEYLGNEEAALEFGKFVKECYVNASQLKITGEINRERDLEKRKQLLLAYWVNCRNCLDVCARCGDFDAFCLAMEYNRKPDIAFYFPRRAVFLKLHIIQDLQDLSDGKLDVLAISMPQRTGKSRIGLFFLTYMLMRNLHKEKQIFGVGHSTGLINSFYDEILMYLTDTKTYRVFEIFNGHSVVDKSSDEHTISLDRVKGMPDIAFKSIDGNITGTVEGGLLMYADDLVKDQSEIINNDLADKLWSKFNTLVLGRMKEGVPLIYMGTMWGTNCPISRLKEAYSEENMSKIGLKTRCRFNSISCYDENGESQFNYLFNVGFTTEHFKKIQLTLEKSDRALWNAMYLAKPISRLGRPFENITFYDELPEIKPDFIGSVIDVATTVNNDNWSCPIGLFYEKEREVYIDEVVYNNKGTDITIPQTIEMFLRRRPDKIEVEEKEPTKGAIRTGIGAKLNELLLKNDFRSNLHSHSACGASSKKERILKYRTDILGIKTEFAWTIHFNKNRYEKEEEYKNFCNDIMNWSEEDIAQKRQVDDSIDSLSQLMEYCTPKRGGYSKSKITLKNLGL